MNAVYPPVMEISEGLEGLTERQAEERLARFGPNIVREPRTRTVIDIARNTLREPMFLLLLAAALLYLLVGDVAEGIFLAAGALLSLSLVILQEARSERALRALNALAEPRALVLRDGKARSIRAAGLVPGDLLVLGEGGRVPADAVLVAGDALQVDESALTGESATATKKPVALEATRPKLSTPGDELTASLFAATVIVRGQGVAQVVSTGTATHVGRIGLELGEIVEGPTLLQQDIRRLIRRLGVLALLFCVLVASAYGLLRGDWFAGALSGLTLAISLIPEEFPMVLTIFMALGALRLAHHKVLVRRSAVIETLGATTLLCVDKTGTLTENRMSLRRLWHDGQCRELTGGGAGDLKLLEAAQRASAVRPNDPMDTAVHAAMGKAPQGNPLRSYPLRPEFLAFVQVWPVDGKIIYAAKGAAEAILALCDVADPRVAEATSAAHALGSSGFRVLAVATAVFPQDPQLPPDKVRYRLDGLLGFEDPVRDDVPQALIEASHAGVSVAMITGDSPATALAAARIAGISTEAGVITGSEIAAGREVSLNARVFARITPDQKLDLVRRFKDAGQVVAMTGDGINDAPALGAADIGIAMGCRGTDVAREAADLILLDDRFASIIGGIALGRRIFANLRRAMIYITAIHVPVAGLALLPILLGLPPLLYPMHLVLLELLIDPICSLVFEGEPSAPDAMKRPPRKAGEALFGRRHLSIALVQGLVLLAVVLGLYAWLIQSGSGEAVSRASAIIALATGHLSLAVAESSTGGAELFSRARTVFWSIVAGAITVMTAAITVPVIAAILRFQTPPPSLLFGSVAAGLVAGGWWAGANILWSKRSSEARAAIYA